MAHCRSLDIWKIDPSLRQSPEELKSWLAQNLPFMLGPSIESIEPLQGAGGATWLIRGTLFAQDPADNHVAIGGAACTVLRATPSELIVEIPHGTEGGPIEVQVGSHRAVAAEACLAALMFSSR